jgi:hypothetical protein
MESELLKNERQRIGNILFHLRTKKNVCKLNFSNISGLNRATIDTIETGRDGYNIDSLILYKMALKRIIKCGNSYKLK